MRVPALPALLACGLVLTTGAVGAPALAQAAAATSVSAAAAQPLLQQGSRGQAVADWQRVLDRAVAADVVQAPRVRPDGIFGPATRRVTVALQARAGVRQDGVVGPRTRDAVAGLLDAAPPVQEDASLRIGSRGQDVRDWQRAVNRAVAAGEVDARRLTEDGVYGPATRAATLAVQRTLGVPADGVVDERTRDGLAGLLDG